jgi:hypothetical protein
MSRIPRRAVVSAVVKVRAMELTQKERLVDELFQEQSHVFGSFLVQRKFGVSLAKMDFLLDIVLICFQAMKESGPRGLRATLMGKREHIVHQPIVMERFANAFMQETAFPRLRKKSINGTAIDGVGYCVQIAIGRREHDPHCAGI